MEAEGANFDQDIQFIPANDISNQINRVIGAISKVSDNNLIIGTGILLSPNMVLSSSYGSNARKFEPKLNQQLKFNLIEPMSKSMVSYDIESLRFPRQSLKNNDKKYDYCLLKLREPVKNLRNKKERAQQYLCLSIPCEQCLKNQKDIRFSFYGYPSQVNQINQIPHLQQYGTKNSKLVKIQKGLINCSISIRKGHQGSPIFLNKQIIGIITKGIREKNQNQGISISSQIIKDLKKWCIEQNGMSFQTNQLNLCRHLQNRQKQEYLRKQQQRRLASELKLLARLAPQKMNLKMTNIKQLDLSNVYSKQEVKMDQKSMVMLSKLQLPHLEELNIENNRIRDKGLQVLCKNEFPSIKQVGLDDNSITINGLRHILQNKWNQKTNYKLYAVQSNDSGFHLNIGDNIPAIKKMIDQAIIMEVDQLINTDQAKAFNAFNLLMVTPLNDERPQNLQQKSNEIQKKLREESTNNPLSTATIKLLLKQKIGSSLKFDQKSDIKSKLSAKIIFTGLMGERVKFDKKFKSLTKFQFSDFKGNHKKLKEFETWFFEHLRTQYGVDTTDMSLDKVTEGSINATASDSSKNAYTINQKYFQKIADDVKVFFERLQLTDEQFDQKGNYNFPKIQKAQIQERGGLPYYQPVLGRRFGINIMNLYGKNNNWLKMDSNNEEWAVVFHGVNYPTQNNKIRSIMNGRKNGSMLWAGDRQLYKDKYAINRDNQLVGSGVYVSPYFLTCLYEYSSINLDQKFHLVLQCRAKPSSIKITSQRADYWVINKTNDMEINGIFRQICQDVRPYGIILFTKQDYQTFYNKNVSSIALHKNIYHGQEFTKQTWNNKYRVKYANFHYK